MTKRLVCVRVASVLQGGEATTAKLVCHTFMFIEAYNVKSVSKMFTPIGLIYSKYNKQL